MAARAIEAHQIDLVVYGQVQCDFSVDGVGGLDFGQAAVASAFRRVETVEKEMDAIQLAVKLRMRKVEDLGDAMGACSAALTDSNKKTKVTDTIDTSKLYEYKDVLDKYGVTVDGSTLSSKMTVGDVQKWQSAIELALDKENNALQRTTNTMQTVVSKYDTAAELMTKVQKKFDSVPNTIIRNM